MQQISHLSLVPRRNKLSSDNENGTAPQPQREAAALNCKAQAKTPECGELQRLRLISVSVTRPEADESSVVLFI
jgi:hypothetical protein